MAYFPKVDPVKIDPIDLGEIRKENTLAALGNQRLQDMAYESGSRNALNDVLKVNPNATSGEVQNALAQAGYGASAPDVVSKMNNNALARSQILDKANTFAQSMVPMVRQAIKNGQDPQTVWDNGLAGFTSYTGIPVDPAMKQFDPAYLDAIEQGGIPAATRVLQARQDAALQSQGYAPGQDPNTLSTISSMRNAADANQRGWNADRRSVEENERAKEIQPYRIENLQSEIDARRNKQQIVYGPDPSDFRGKRKIPGIVVPGENGGPGTFVPLQGVQGQQPFGSEGDLQGGQMPQSGQPQGQPSQKAPVPGARQAQDGNWYVPDPSRPGKYLRVN